MCVVCLYLLNVFPVCYRPSSKFALVLLLLPTFCRFIFVFSSVFFYLFCLTLLIVQCCLWLIKRCFKTVRTPCEWIVKNHTHPFDVCCVLQKVCLRCVMLVFLSFAFYVQKNGQIKYSSLFCLIFNFVLSIFPYIFVLYAPSCGFFLLFFFCSVDSSKPLASLQKSIVVIYFALVKYENVISMRFEVYSRSCRPSMILSIDFLLKLFDRFAVSVVDIEKWQQKYNLCFSLSN